MISKPYIHFIALTLLNGFLAYFYQTLIKRMNEAWSGLLDEASYPALTNHAVNHGIYVICAFFALSLIATVWFTKNRRKETQSIGSPLFATLTLTEIVYLTVLALGLMLPAITITTHLQG